MSKHSFEHLRPGDIVRVFTAFEPGGYSMHAWQKHMQTFGQPHWKQPARDVVGVHGDPYVVTIEVGNRHSSMMQVMDAMGKLCWFQAADFKKVMP